MCTVAEAVYKKKDACKDTRRRTYLGGVARLHTEPVLGAILVVETGDERQFAGVFVECEHRHATRLDQPVRHRLGLKDAFKAHT
jgi:hypothetical protein